MDELMMRDNVRSLVDICNLLGVSETRIMSWVMGDKIPCIQNKSGVYFDIMEVEEWILSGKYKSVVNDNITYLTDFIELKRKKRETDIA